MAGRPSGVVAAYEDVQTFLLALGGVTVEPLKTRIGFKQKTTFASVQFRKDHLTVSIGVDQVPADKRFTVGERVGSLTVCWFRLDGPGQLDAALQQSLRAAYERAR